MLQLQLINNIISNYLKMQVFLVDVQPFNQIKNVM